PRGRTHQIACDHRTQHQHRSRTGLGTRTQQHTRDVFVVFTFVPRFIRSQLVLTNVENATLPHTLLILNAFDKGFQLSVQKNTAGQRNSTVVTYVTQNDTASTKSLARQRLHMSEN
ncbi:unnamed protein product, partial [Ectocarpus sp. 13 AM-2016]